MIYNPFFLLEVQVLIEQWRNEYNQFRPHSSLNYQPPAPETIKPKVKTLTWRVVQITGAGQPLILSNNHVCVDKMKIIYNTFLIIIPLILIEIISQSIFIYNGKNKYSIILKPFSNQIAKKTTNHLIYWDYSTNKMKPGVYTTDQGITYTINSKGFRGKEFDIKKNKIRVLVFGGSTVVGLESPDDKTYPYIKIDLKEDFPCVFDKYN